MNTDIVDINREYLDPKERFAFGRNWSKFLESLTEARIKEAEKSLLEKLQCSTLEGKKFLDIGSGSGLFSLAAYRLGATVSSFDYDLQSVHCAKYLREQYAKDSNRWDIQQGSILDLNFLAQYDNSKSEIVYSWGVLHHTGHMFQAFENISKLVANQGQLFISIYNDQGSASIRWKKIKEKYQNGGRFLKLSLCLYTLIKQWGIAITKDFLKTGNPFRSWWHYGNNNRGMSAWHDIVDWTGGYPFEVAKPEKVFDFFKKHDFQLEFLKTCAGGLGCNEFIFRKCAINHRHLW